MVLNGPQLVSHPGCWSMAVFNRRQTLLSMDKRYVHVLSRVVDYSSQTVLDALFLSQILCRQTSEKIITIIKTTPNKGICSHDHCFMCEIVLESPEISNTDKTTLT